MHRLIKHIFPSNFYGLLAWGYTLFLTGISLYPKPDVHLAQGSDKTIHFFLYFFLFVLWNGQGQRNVWRLAGVLVLFGVIIEVLQSALPVHRSGDVWDALVNALGVLTAMYVCKDWSKD